MDYIVFTITLSILVIILLKYLIATFFNYSEVDYIKAHDNKNYVVLNLPDKKQAADKLADINKLINDIIGELETLPDREVTLEQRGKIKKIRQKFKSHFIENAPGNKTTSYTLNKGNTIYMCLRTGDKENKLIDDNTLTFVALHELSHVMTLSIGHTPEFWANFRFILSHAIKKGHYNYHPYNIVPKKYCGTTITSQP